MAGFLVAEEGPLAGLIIRLEEGNEWIIGRDPEVCFQALEDPMVSRKHVICRLTDEGYFIENLSAVNPANVNGKPVTEPTPLQEDDTVQIGNVFFRFTKHDPAFGAETPPEEIEKTEETLFEEAEPLESFSLTEDLEARWIIKVISGPNSGAEFGIHSNTTTVIGKDPASCDIVFQDLSVSRQHARIIVDEDNSVTIEDLNSRNGVFVNGRPIEDLHSLDSQDLIALGTTTFLIIDREQMRETIVSPPSALAQPSEMTEEEKEEALAEQKAIAEEKGMEKDWKKMRIPMRHLALAGLFGVLLIIGVMSVFSLFKAKPVEITRVDEKSEIEKVTDKFPSVGFSFNPGDGTLFLVGHVLTEIDHQELTYLLKTLPFITQIEDNVVIDELVWESVNALIVKNPNWRGVNVVSYRPGHFILKGYVQTVEESTKLSEYINIYFPYLDRLQNEVAVENTMGTEIQSLLLEKGLANVTFQISNGELILAGRVNANDERKFKDAVEMINDVKGVREVKNFVIFTTVSTERINLSDRFQVTGTSKLGNISEFVVINGRILSKGDKLDGMEITDISPNAILLEKDGLKFEINYNQQ